MIDCFTADIRSKVMTAVKSNGNKSTELTIIQIFRYNNISGWRRHQNIVGRPDFVFKKHKVAVFADGCFWHEHNCRNTKPKTNEKFWREKITRNKRRDKRYNNMLRKTGWTVFRFWECEINKGHYKGKLGKLIVALRG